jgi:hypothetical protein
VPPRRRGKGLRVPRLTAFYRVTPHGNGKPRPGWFSKRLALRSFLGALARVGDDVRLVHVADSGVPAELTDLVRASGEVVHVRGGSAPKSFRRLLRVARDVPGDGLVWFAEDDYLYRPEALTALVGAVDALPHADLFGLYTPDNTPWHADHASQPGRRGGEQEHEVDGRTWRRTWDSTSTFGVRAGALRADARLLALCSRTGGPWDNTCVTVVQGVAPYPWRQLGADLYLRPSRASAGRVVSRPLLRAAVDVAALLRPGRTWVAPATSLATHVEPGHLAPGTDWEALAREQAQA